MKKLNCLILFILNIFFISYASSSETIGFYSKGRLLGAQSVFEKGTPIHKLFVSRNRLYTSDEMHDLLRIAAEFIRQDYPNTAPLQIGDLSNHEGGLAKGHASHQNGLDADVVYIRNNNYVQSPKSDVWDEDFISKNTVSNNFSIERNFALFKHLVSTTPITRIFVDTVIKKALCDFAEKTGAMNDPMTIETLRRLRPQDLHRTHFHARIGCPVNDHECTPQSAPSTGSGCGELGILLDLTIKDQSC
jgi:penicillin-insensitive murein endopeptidase